MPYAGISSLLPGSDKWFPWAFDAFLLKFVITSTKTMKEMTATTEMAAAVPGESGGGGGEGSGGGSGLGHISD